MTKGEDAICPQSGARLSLDRHPDEVGRPHREPETDECSEMSTGAAESSTTALVTFFRRSYRAHHEDLDRELLRRAATVIQTLKRETDHVRDEWIWYAACERLHRQGFEVAWMRTQLNPVCPHCGSELTAELAPKGEVLPKCGINCRDDNRYVAGDIAEAVREAFNQAFDEEIESGHLQIA